MYPQPAYRQAGNKIKINFCTRVIETEIKAPIEKYKESIDNADTALASNYGHIPMKFLLYIQEEVNTGWQEINNHIYKFFGDTFSKHVRRYNHPHAFQNDKLLLRHRDLIPAGNALKVNG